MRNPWLDIGEADYVGHMSSPAVNQRPVLNELLREVLQTYRPRHLEVVRTTDSDGDAHYTLLVRDESRKRTIATSNLDDAELMDCARWLESATGFRLITY
jgi:hypothetical protein